MSSLKMLTCLGLGSMLSLKPLLAKASSAPKAAAVGVTKIDYQDGGVSFSGLLVQPQGKAVKPRPAILLIHNWLGISPETERQATRYAEQGFVVFAADIYGKDVRPKGPEEAGKVAGLYKTNRALYRERLRLGLATLEKQPGIDHKRIAALGYCFGGTGVLELARSGADIGLAVSFHGGLDSPTPQDGAQIKAKVLVLHGAIDPMISANDLAAFEGELNQHKVDWQMVKYGGAVHSFTDISAGSDLTKGVAYNAAADRRSFQATLAALGELN